MSRLSPAVPNVRRAKAAFSPLGVNRARQALVPEDSMASVNKLEGRRYAQCGGRGSPAVLALDRLVCR
jgi:hypothetical protein